MLRIPEMLQQLRHKLRRRGSIWLVVEDHRIVDKVHDLPVMVNDHHLPGILVQIHAFHKILAVGIHHDQQGLLGHLGQRCGHVNGQVDILRLHPVDQHLG